MEHGWAWGRSPFFDVGVGCVAWGFEHRPPKLPNRPRHENPTVQQSGGVLEGVPFKVSQQKGRSIFPQRIKQVSWREVFLGSVCFPVVSQLCLHPLVYATHLFVWSLATNEGIWSMCTGATWVLRPVPCHLYWGFLWLSWAGVRKQVSEQVGCPERIPDTVGCCPLPLLQEVSLWNQVPKSVNDWSQLTSPN